MSKSYVKTTLNIHKTSLIRVWWRHDQRKRKFFPAIVWRYLSAKVQSCILSALTASISCSISKQTNLTTRIFSLFKKHEDKKEVNLVLKKWKERTLVRTSKKRRPCDICELVKLVKLVQRSWDRIARPRQGQRNPSEMMDARCINWNNWSIAMRFVQWYPRRDWI